MYTELSELVGSDGPATVDGLTAATIRALRQDAQNLQYWIGRTAGRRVELDCMRISWNGLTGDLSRTTVLAIADRQLFWLRDRASGRLSLDPYSRMFYLADDPSSLAYEPLGLPLGVTPSQVGVRWLDQVPLVVLEQGSATNGSEIRYVFNPETAQFMDLAAARQQLELANADPNEWGTWPAWAQLYFAHPDMATSSEGRRFDQFLTDLRNSVFQRMGREDPQQLRTLLVYLVRGGVLTDITVEEVEAMDGTSVLAALDTMLNADRETEVPIRRHVLWLCLIQAALEQRSVILSPREIQQIVLDWESYRGPFGSLLPQAPGQPSIYYFRGSLLAQGDEPGELPQPVIFGQAVFSTDRIASIQELAGDLAGLVELPMGEGSALLVRLRNAQGRPLLQIYHIEDQGLRYEPSQRLCVGLPESECVTELNGSVSLYNTHSDGGATAAWRPLTLEVIRQQLQWPPVAVRLQTSQHLSDGSLLLYSYHPRSNLIVARRLSLVPPDTFRNPP